MKIAGRSVRICCMSLAIAVRVIGCLGLFASLMLIIQLSAELWQHDGSSKISKMLDLDDQVIDEDTAQHHSYHTVRLLVGLLVFSCFYMVSSALLIYSSIVSNRIFTVPWLICEFIGFVSQVTGLVYYAERHNAPPDTWLLIITTFSLVLTLYFWTTVIFAQYEWKIERPGPAIFSPQRGSDFSVGFDNRGFANSVKISRLPV